MTVEELVAALVALVIVSAKRLGAGLANRAIEGVEQSVAGRLGRLYRWIAGRLPGEEGVALVDEAGRSPAAQALLRRRLLLALGEDPAGIEELRKLWSLIEPLLPAPGPKLVEGRPRLPDRQALCGILFVLHTGIQWEYLPQELGFGSGMTCWRRLAAWNEAGVWDALHLVLLERLRAAKKLDWSRAVIDSSHVQAARRGPKADPAPSSAHDRAASTTSSPTLKASRSRCR